MSTFIKSNWKVDYHEQSDFQFQAGKKAIDQCNLNGDELVLDVGCGTGRTTNYCAQKLTTGSVIGVDLSEDMIRFAKKEYKDMPNLAFQVGSATELAFNNEFDVVYSMFCLHWVKEQEAAIQKVAQSLKPDGRALLYISHESTLSKVFDSCVAKIVQNRPEWKENTSDYIYLQPASAWIGWCNKAGLHVRSHRIMERGMTLPTLNDCKNLLKPLAAVWNMSDEDRDEFLDLVLREVYRIYDVGENELLILLLQHSF